MGSSGLRYYGKYLKNYTLTLVIVVERPYNADILDITGECAACIENVLCYG
ncbi:hypothetical protein [Leptothoe sp. PORK10 BA2]|uniref:hypothetical protein n=1 Tax=Leptothoe sp. PORK10 BA2 TaxID=3110254 RepID=UPI002B2124F0|nr:hypothetical protein [Leptothoe sp. PORK10 BA2]MEA5466327.1 hypothetical protein [Leptothoe sp. PORK10 BA2]